MADGFNLCLEDYCSYCGNFESDIEKVDVSTLRHSPRYSTDIRCMNRSACEQIKVNIERNIVK